MSTIHVTSIKVDDVSVNKCPVKEDGPVKLAEKNTCIQLAGPFIKYGSKGKYLKYGSGPNDFIKFKA